MATSRWRQSLTVIERLCREPYGFEFFQAVRLLERAAATEHQVGTFGLVSGANHYSRELVCFSAQTSLSFPGSDIVQLQRRTSPALEGNNHQEVARWQMQVGFTGLAGSQGVMPYYLTEVLLKELRKKNTSLRDFLDLFNHRHISLFYQASYKYQLPVNYERNKATKNREFDLFSHALSSLVGLGSRELRYRMPIADEALLGMAGHLSRQQCSVTALKGMIRHYFGLDVVIEQFQGQWDVLPEDVLCRLPSASNTSGVNNYLGVSTVLGTRCFQAQNKFRVVIKPMVYEEFMGIAPGTVKLEALKAFIHFSAGVEMDFEISVTLLTSQVAPVQLSSAHAQKPLLGWNSHMVSAEHGEDCVHITLSADQECLDEALPVT